MLRVIRVMCVVHVLAYDDVDGDRLCVLLMIYGDYNVVSVIWYNYLV